LDPIDLEELSPASLPLHLSSEQRQILDQLCLYRDRGPGAYRPNLRSFRVVLFFASCLAISAGLIVFSNRIPPVISTLTAGFIVGVLFTGTRQQTNFERQWPLIESIIDWKFVDRLRNAPEPSDGSAA
jgi:hypothetical protein